MLPPEPSFNAEKRPMSESSPSSGLIVLQGNRIEDLRDITLAACLQRQTYPGVSRRNVTC